MTDASVDRTAAILDYHEATKHSPESIRRRGLLDWANKPHPFKVYAGLQRVPLPEEIPSLGVPALETIDTTAVGDPGPGPDLASLARLLVRGAGVHHVVTFPAAVYYQQRTGGRRPLRPRGQPPPPSSRRRFHQPRPPDRPAPGAASTSVPSAWMARNLTSSYADPTT